MTTINITAEKVSLSFANPAAAFVPGVISSLVAQPTVELEWSNTLLGGERVDYKAAEKAVAKLGDGWRLPTRRELESLLDLSRHEPAIDTDKYPDTKSSPYWTSSECAWNSEARWVVHFSLGFVAYYLQDSYACVRAVRASQ
jgi:hypothetical protein